MKQIKEHFNNKNNFIVFLIIFIGIMCPLFSGKLEFNFWTNMNDVLTSPVAIICLFIASIITLIITLISFVFSVYVPFTKTGAFDYKFGTYNSFFAIVEALCLFYIIKHYFENINIKCEKIINEISLCTFGIFLFHYPAIDRFFYMLIMQKIFAFNPYIGTYTLQITVFITTGLITYLLRKIPIIKRFL